MDKNTPHLSKLTKAYLSKFFENKQLPHDQWTIVRDGVRHVVDNQQVIQMILNAQPEQQRMLADTLYELDESNVDINVFLKHLAVEGNILGQVGSPKH